MHIEYFVQAPEPRSHRLVVRLRIDGVEPPTVDLVLPSWVPGSYWIRDQARFVRRCRAWGDGSAEELAVDRPEKDRFRISVAAHRRIEVEIVSYAHELLKAGTDVTDEHLWMNPAWSLPYVDGHRDAPVGLTVSVPSDWRVHTTLSEVPGAPNRYTAASYDALVDAPIDAGSLEIRSFRVRRIPHRIVLCGRGGNHDPDRLERDLASLAEATGELFDEMPTTPYTFFVHLTDRWEGGLEHADSCALVVPRQQFRPELRYRRFLELAAHEYVHRFNVKRIRPAVFRRPDLTREVYTRWLWWMEGTTDYLSLWILVRAGLLPTDYYLERIAEKIRDYRATPGRLVTGVEDASRLAWIQFYHPHEDQRNQSISYYLAGHLASLCLDLELRHRSDGRVSLGSVARQLYREYGANDRGLEESEALADFIERAAGIDVREFFGRYIERPSDLDFDRFVAYAGLELRPAPADPSAPQPAGDVGVDVEDAMGRARIAFVRDGSPAHRAGLSPQDEIVAIDGRRVLFTDFPAVVEEYAPGSPIRFTVFRRGWLTHVDAEVGAAPVSKLRLERADSADPVAVATYDGWLGRANAAAPAEGGAGRSRTGSSGVGSP